MLTRVRTSTSGIETSELLGAIAEAFDHVVYAHALAVDNSLKGRLVLRMKRRFVMRAAERCIQAGDSLEDIADSIMNETVRLNCIPR